MLIALVLIYITSAACNEVDVKYVKVNSSCYNVSHLLDLRAPFRNKVVIPKMVILRSKNILFYSFEPNITDDEYYKVGFVNLDTPDTFGVLSATQKSLFNFGTFDIDQTNDLIYLGGSAGIYVLDTKVNRLTPYSSFGDTILSLVYSNSVYFTRKGENKIVQKKDDNFNSLLEYQPIKNFVITKYGYIVFLSNYGLFVEKDGITVELSKNAFFRGLAIDVDGNVYAWWIDYVYKVVIDKNLSESKLVTLAYVPMIGTITFDNLNNMLFTAGRGLYRLTKTDIKEC